MLTSAWVVSAEVLSRRGNHEKFTSLHWVCQGGVGVVVVVGVGIEVGAGVTVAVVVAVAVGVAVGGAGVVNMRATLLEAARLHAKTCSRPQPDHAGSRCGDACFFSESERASNSFVDYYVTGGRCRSSEDA